MSKNEIDNSLEDFFSSLYDFINNDEVPNSFKDFNFTLNYKNKLYYAIESYKDNGTIFYSNFITEYPGINIKRIGDIVMGPKFSFRGRLGYKNGKYYLKFTVYYERTDKLYYAIESYKDNRTKRFSWIC